MQNREMLGLSLGVLTLLVAGLGYLEMKAARERTSELAIDRLAAAAAQRKARVNTDSVALLQEDLQRLPDPVPVAASVPPPLAAPPPPPPPASVLPSMPPPPLTRPMGAFPEADPKDMSTRPMGLPTSAPPAKEFESFGNTSGSWADMLQKVRANEAEMRPKSSASEAKSSASGSGAWEALLKKASTGAAETGALGKSGEQAPPAPPKEEDRVDSEGPKRPAKTISLDFGAGSNPFQKSSE